MNDLIKPLQQALGLKVDGIRGPVTTAEILHAADEGRLSVIAGPAVAPLPVTPKTGLKRIVMHWTAGGPGASALDRQHYHFIVQQDGEVVRGDMTPEDNINTSDGRYAAHTKGCNTGAIGVSICGMAGAQERPFSPGSYPIRQPQVAVMCSLVARLCREYGIPITRQTVLSHAEVQPTLGIAQNGKIDIMWLPGMDDMQNPVSVGDILRSDISKALAIAGK